MKYEIPEQEKSKLRLFDKLPKYLKTGSAVIRETSNSWEEAKAGITELISEEIKDLQAIRTLFNSSQPVGPQRKNNLQCYPDRRKQ